MDNVVKGQLGKRIAELRKQSGMTQREMAERLQVTTSALCKWERTELSGCGNDSQNGRFVPCILR